MSFNKKLLLEKFTALKKQGKPIIGGGAGTGLSAKCEEQGGIDLIVIYNSGRYRMAGRGSLSGLMAYGNANDIVLEMANEVLPVVKHTPVLAGVNGTDPFCNFNGFLDTLKTVGFAGVQNFPTVGLIDGVFRQNLEQTGISYAQEVAMIKMAHNKGLLTTPYVFSTQNTIDMTNAGADIIVCHMGLTTGGNIGAKTAMGLDDCVTAMDTWAMAARKINPDILVLIHGGPVSSPEDADYVMQHSTQCDGFYGASSMERLPVEEAIKQQTEKFKAIGKGIK